jgi:hypothetical protein
MIFPELGPQYYNERDRGILSRMEAFYAEGITINQSFWQEADTDTRFECGDATLWNEMYGNLPINRRRNFNFNRIRRVINMISGYQRRNRKSTIITPVENSDEMTADQFTKIMMWIHQQEGVLETISNSFHGSLVTGMNLLQVWVDYRNDPISGTIRVDNCAYNSFLIDPFFRKADLSDCNAIWKRSFLTKREILSLLPDKEDEIMGLVANDQRDGKFQFMPETYNYGLKNLLSYDEYYYRDYRTQTMMVDTQSGECMEWKGDDEALKDFLYLYPQVTTVKSEVPTVNLAIVVQGKVMYNDRQPNGLDLYPFIPVFAYYNPQMPYYPWRIQGVVRGLRDAQYLYNRRKVIELDILESQINSGWKYKENALVNPKDIFLTGQGRGLALKEEAQMTDVEQIQAPQIPPSMFQLSESLSKEVMEISGVNEELLGSAMDDKAGILSMLRQGAGLTTLQILFDNLDYAQKQLGKVILQLIQANFTPGKVKRIINEEPTKQFYNKMFGTYDAVVEEGLNTSTQKQMALVQLLQFRNEIGMPIPFDRFLDLVNLQDKKALMEAVKAQEQQQAQMAQAQAQMQQEQAQAQIKMAMAKATADEGLGVERLSRVQENQSLAIERQAQALRDEDEGALALVKAIKELEGIDLDNVVKALQVMGTIKMSQRAEQEQNLQDLGPSPVPQQPQGMGPMG